MIIEKDRKSVGWYIARFKTSDPQLGTLHACGDSHWDCVKRMFEKLIWAEYKPSTIHLPDNDYSKNA